jgi:hypothetical protein
LLTGTIESGLIDYPVWGGIWPVDSEYILPLIRIPGSSASPQSLSRGLREFVEYWVFERTRCLGDSTGTVGTEGGLQRVQARIVQVQLTVDDSTLVGFRPEVVRLIWP